MLLVNNNGGGIFSFLSVADSVPSQHFNPLWATPQNVDLEGAAGGAGGEGSRGSGGGLQGG